MSRADRETLKQAIWSVRSLGLAPFLRLRNAMPRNMSGQNYARWLARQKETTGSVKTALEEKGAVITIDGDWSTIRFAGIKASSTMGLSQALKNWRYRAEAALRPRHGGARK